MSSKKYQRRYPYSGELKYLDRCDSEFIINATPQEIEKIYSQNQEFLDILNRRSPNRDNKEDIIDALIEYRELDNDKYAKKLRDDCIEEIIKCDEDEDYLKEHYDHGCELVHVLKKYNLNRKNREDLRYALEKAEELAKLIDIEIEAEDFIEKDIQELEEIYSPWFLDKVSKYCSDWSNREDLINAITIAHKEKEEEDILFEPEEEAPKDWNEMTKEEQDEIRSWSEHANLEWDEKKQEWFDPFAEKRDLNE